MNIVKVVRVDAKGAAYDIKGNRIANGKIEGISAGCYVAYRTQTMTQQEDPANPGQFLPLDSAAYWENKIATAAFATKEAALEAMNEEALFEAESKTFVAGQLKGFAATYNLTEADVAGAIA